jgi:hypothetical protein
MAKFENGYTKNCNSFFSFVNMKNMKKGMVRNSIYIFIIVIDRERCASRLAPCEIKFLILKEKKTSNHQLIHNTEVSTRETSDL